MQKKAFLQTFPKKQTKDWGVGFAFGELQITNAREATCNSPKANATCNLQFAEGELKVDYHLYESRFSPEKNETTHRHKVRTFP